ncbi:MAG: AAA family ATPase [Rhodocyclaceae bacterium]|nr:AAA family ATPase [Rhodocyclaceae bacterium]
MAADIDRALRALHAIDPGCDRETWVKAAMAAKAAGLGVDCFTDWSSTASNFGGEADCRSVWKSINGIGGIGPATLFGMARDAGWRDEANGHDKAHQRPQEPPKPRPKATASSCDVGAVWDAGESATVGHGYIARKRGLAEGLRVHHGSWIVAGQELDGALLVPVMDAEGKLQSVQAIPAEGAKRSAPGAPIRGGRLVVGGAIEDVVYVVEGIGQAWSAHQATGKPAVVCFGAGNVEAIAHDLRERHPQTRIIIVADAGKEADAERVAGAVGGAWVGMPEGSPANFDLNDFHQQAGSLDPVAQLLADAVDPDPPDEPAEPDIPRLLDLEALAGRRPEPPHFLVPGWLPAGEPTLFGAHGGTGKSALALRLAVCRVLGRDFYGLPCERGAVDFVSYEDSEKVLHWRLSRVCDVLGVPMADVAPGLRLFDGTQCLSGWFARGEHGETGPTEAFHEMAGRIGGPGRLVIVDGASDVYAGNENDRAQVKAFIRTLRRLIAEDGALILIAHVDKQGAKAGSDALGFSGSTGWHNSVRCRWFAYAETDEEGGETGNIVVEVRKSNLGRSGASLVLAFDETSGTFERVDTGQAPRGRVFQRVDEAEAIIAVVRDAWIAGDPIPAASSGTRTAHSVAEARGALPASLRGRTGRKRFYRALEELRASKAVCVEVARRGNRHLTEVLNAPE